MALIYKPIKRENVDRDWKITLTLEIISDFLEAKFPDYNDFITREFNERKDRILLKDTKIRLTYYSEGKESIIDEMEGPVLPGSTS